MTTVNNNNNSKIDFRRQGTGCSLWEKRQCDGSAKPCLPGCTHGLNVPASPAVQWATGAGCLLLPRVHDPSSTLLRLGSLTCVDGLIRLPASGFHLGLDNGEPWQELERGHDAGAFILLIFSGGGLSQVAFSLSLSIPPLFSCVGQLPTPPNSILEGRLPIPTDILTDTPRGDLVNRRLAEGGREVPYLCSSRRHAGTHL